ncbi:hypothetical protein QZH41_004492 [Actinostola sp. cb2023]|nr:hypothetical protein QZH41_004492 [Actinostola sp. cb2023]
MWEEEFPVGHPDLYFGDRLPPLGDSVARVISVEWFGLIRCEVDPPRNLHFPVLPKIIQHKLMSPCVPRCAENETTGRCTHEATQRRLKGVWTSVELRAALTRGYRLHAVHEAWLYASRSNSMFRDYIRENLRLKLEASGCPDHCTTDEARDAFLAEVKEHQQDRAGSREDEEDRGTADRAQGQPELGLGGALPEPLPRQDGIRDLPRTALRAPARRRAVGGKGDDPVHARLAGALRTVARCRRRQSQRQRRGRLVRDGPRPTAAPPPTGAAGRTPRPLYHHTDSIIYTTRSDEPEVPVGSRLDQWSDECGNPEENWIVEFVALGSKTYAYRTHKGKCVVRCKGISFTPLVKEKVHFEGLLDLLTGHEEVIEDAY